jgi:hypothetical protein
MPLVADRTEKSDGWQPSALSCERISIHQCHMLCEEFASAKELRSCKAALETITFTMLQVNFAEFTFHALR